MKINPETVTKPVAYPTLAKAAAVATVAAVTLLSSSCQQQQQQQQQQQDAQPTGGVIAYPYK